MSIYNEVKFGKEAQDEIYEGAKIVANAVASTLGPNGKTALIEGFGGNSYSVTKDGVSVAKAVGKLKNQYQNIGGNLVKNIASESAKTGDGPQPLYAKVLTPNGFVRIDSLKIGDEVCRIDGTTQKVIGIYPKGKKELYRVHFDHGDYVECCADHLWTVTNVNTPNKKLTTMTTSQLVEYGIYRKGQGKYKSCKFYVPHNKSFFTTKEVPIDPFLLGVLIGDGCFTEKMDYCEITIGYNKEKKIIPNLVLPEGIFLKREDCPKRHACRFKFKGKTKDGKTMLNLLKDIGLLGCNSFTKHIPQDYLINSFENREKLLKGLLSNDGYISNRNLAEYSTVSKQLNDDIIFLFKSLGFDVYTQLKERSIENGAFSNTPIYRICQLKGHKYGKRITAIEDMHREEEMMCIKVDSDEELYITDNFITTHNTTTASVLGISMLENGRKYLASGVKVSDLKKGIDCATKLAIEKIKEKSKEIRNETDILNVATIASNNDEKIGKLVSEAYSQIGEDGILTVEDSPKTETYLEFVEGMQFNNGYESQYFVNNTDRMTCEFKNPYILITDEEINNLNVLGKILNQIANEGRSLLIIANGYGGQTMPALVFNAVNKTLQVCAVKGPEFGEMRKEILTDIAILTGGSFISESLGKSLLKMEMSDLGSAEKVVVSKDNTLIVGGKCEKSSLDERIEHIKSEMSIETVEKKKENMKKRIASLSGGICVLRVYADNDVEMKELKDRIEDTICSVKASVKEGIVLGGGVTLLKVSSELEPPKELTDSQICGFNIVKDALESPIRQLAKNSGVSDDVIVEKTLTQSDGEKSGYNFATMEWDENLFDKVVDPTLVETSALKNASSFIGLYLNTNVVITTVNDDEGNECNCGR